MSRIQDYASLCQAIIDFSHRPTLSPFCDYFIQGSEDRIYRKILELNEGEGVRAMESPISGTIDSNGTFAVPTDYLSLKGATVTVASSQCELLMKEAAWIYSAFPVRAPSGPPKYIARDGAVFIFGPFPDQGYTVMGTYYQRAPALSAQNPITWMTNFIPLILHAGAMVEVAKFLKDQESMQSYLAELTDRLTDFVSQDKAERYSGGSLVINAV